MRCAHSRLLYDLPGPAVQRGRFAWEPRTGPSGRELGVHPVRIVEDTPVIARGTKNLAQLLGDASAIPASARI